MFTNLDASNILTLDNTIIFLYFCTVLFIGFWSSRKVKTLEDYSTGNRSYTSFFVFATLSSSFIGGGFTSGLAEKVYSLGLVYVIALWGFSIKEVLIANYIVPKMTRFKNAISVGDIMGRLYGHNARILSGIASVLVCAGIAGAQFAACGYMFNILLGIPQSWSIAIGASVVVLYSSLGGMRSVVANDTLHFLVLVFALPTVFVLGIIYVGGFEPIMTMPDFNSFGTNMPLITLIGLFLSFFFGETLVPPYVQRLLIGKDLIHTAKGTLWSGLLSFPFFLIVGFIGLIAYKINPTLNANLALPFVIKTVMPIGLKGFAIAGMMAVVMSSADSFLNAAAISASHDVIKPLWKINDPLVELMFSRLTTVIVGATGALFAISTESVLDILLNAYNFWTPFILIPLVAGILGVKRSSQTFWVSSFAGVSSVFLVNYYKLSTLSNFDAALVGILVNGMIFWLYNPEAQTEPSSATL